MTIRVLVTHASPDSPASLVVELIDMFDGALLGEEALITPGGSHEFTVHQGRGLTVEEVSPVAGNPEMADNTAPE